MAVILDMVFNHATGNCPFASLYWNSSLSRPAAGNPWMNETAPHGYNVFNDFNHTSQFTKDYFKRVLQYWITEYKVDGYRLDLTMGFKQDTSNDYAYNTTRVGILKEYYDAAKTAKSDVMFILEHWVSPEEPDLTNYGMYCWKKLNSNYIQAAEGYQTGSDFSGMKADKWVSFAESHDEERVFFAAKQWGVGTIASDSLVRISRVPVSMAFNTLIPGPKMIWEFAELGYDKSITSNSTSAYTGTKNTDAKPSYLALAKTSAPRKAAYEACCKIINLRKSYSNAFHYGYCTLNAAESDWTAGRRIALTHADLNMIVLGNFNTATITANPAFQNTGTWYNLLTGEALNVSNTNMTISMQPGQLLIYTDRIVNLPNAVNAPMTDAECTVFPTVTVSKVYITSPTAIKNAKIFNLQGAQLKSVINSNEIDFSTFNNGLYIMEVNTCSGRSIHKIVKE